MGRYKDILTDEIELKSQTSLQEQEERQHKIEKDRIIKQNDDKKAELMEYFGEEKFNELYGLCLFFREQEDQGGDFQKKQYEAMKQAVGGVKYDLTQLFILDGIVFKELLNMQMGQRNQ